jgi:DNA-binding MarR family transcriptional regulator
LAQLAGQVLTSAVLRRLDGAGFGDLRTSHGFVFQHLVDGPRTIGELAGALGVTPQAASLAVVELEALGYVRREVDADDRRVRRVTLTDRGRAGIEAARAARRELAGLLEERVGRETVESARRALVAAIDLAGGTDDIRHRRVPPPR